jgi:hypothetical protein
VTIIGKVAVSGRLAATAVVLGSLAASCASHPAVSSPGASAPAGRGAASGRVIALNQMSTMRALFNRADGHPRLVLIFSPT